MKRFCLSLLTLFLISSYTFSNKLKTVESLVNDEMSPMKEIQKSHQVKPVRVGVIGLVHDHVGWILGREPIGDIEIVGIVEPNKELASRYCKRYNYPADIVYKSIKAI